MSAPKRLDSLLGLTLDEARGHLQAHQPGSTVEIKETSAQFSRAAQPVFGELRVLRARYLPVTPTTPDSPPAIELLVAREMLKDERAPAPSA